MENIHEISGAHNPNCNISVYLMVLGGGGNQKTQWPWFTDRDAHPLIPIIEWKTSSQWGTDHHHQYSLSLPAHKM